MPAEAGISGGSCLDLISLPPEMPASAGMTSNKTVIHFSPTVSYQ
ncbi:hypothetical protein [Rhizorhabdus wittichii]|jgi:hypothetical protein|nr:hypothetical protein [Rhizorhabdus wittichii]